jgi:hypothetical protein
MTKVHVSDKMTNRGQKQCVLVVDHGGIQMLQQEEKNSKKHGDFAFSTNKTV